MLILSTLFGWTAGNATTWLPVCYYVITCFCIILHIWKCAKLHLRYTVEHNAEIPKLKQI